MHAVGADDEREVVFAAVVEAHMDGVAAVVERGKRGAVADLDAHLARAFGEDALEIGPAQIDVFVVEGAAHPLDRIARVRLCRRRRRIQASSIG